MNDILLNLVTPSTAHMSTKERRAGIQQMLCDLNRLATQDGCIAVAWALEALNEIKPAPQLDNYDPNVYWGTHKVEVSLQKWDYVGTLQYDLGGNCKGFGVIDNCVDILIEQLYGDIVTLKNAKGDTLECDILDETDLERMIVGIRIIEMKPEVQS